MTASGLPLVSVIMNCYNGDKYLRRAVDSVLAQSYGSWEIVFWDNQSTDDSARIIKSYVDPRINYHYAPTHTVLYEARNCALERCRGELVAFLDVDDWWLPEKLQTQVVLFEDPAVGMSCSNYVLVNERAGQVSTPAPRYDSLPTGQVLNDLFGDYFVHISTLVVRMSAFKALRVGFDSRFNILGDFDMLVRLAVEWKMASVQQPLAFYRWHENNTGLLSRFQISDELQVWYGENASDPVYSTLPNFTVFAHRVALYGVLRSLYEGDRGRALRLIGRLSASQKAKAFTALLLPRFLVRAWLLRSWGRPA